MTATGRTAGRALAGPRLVQAWLPYDVPRFVRAFLAHFRPAAGMLLETELWPNLVAEARALGIPLFLVNARLSERSARGYARVATMAREAFGGLAGIAAQSEADAMRIARFAGAMPAVTGSLKFDVSMPAGALEVGAALRTRFGATRPVWLAASTREGEEALILEAWRTARSAALLVLVPRHPQRFAAVAQALRERAIAYVRRSDAQPVDAAVTVVLGDTMGEMGAYCAAADVVLVGGSLLPFGGQNLIEPMALGKPTVVGPHMWNFAAVTEAALREGAAVQVHDAGEAVATVQRLLADATARQTMARAALALHAREAGAGDRLWRWLAPRLDAALREHGAQGAAVTPPAAG
jgi:3-deoxy-D-manno-octulosonic-acid transferase